MTPRDIVLEQIHHHETDPVPATFYCDEGVGDLLTTYYGDESWREKVVPYISMCCSISRGKKLPLDDIRMTDYFGGVWRMDKRPMHLESPGLSSPSLEGYAFPKASDFADEGSIAHAKKVLPGMTDSFTTIECGWGLWESYWNIRGFNNALLDCVAEPDFFGEVMDRLTDLYIEQLALCEDIPADSFWFGDDWGDQRGIMIGPDLWREFFKPRYARIYEAAHAQGKYVMTHCCGSVADIMDDLIEIGLDVLESVQPEARGMNPYELKKRWGDKITFWGCLGSQSTIPFGTPAEIHAEVAKLRNEMGQGGGFILSAAKPLQPGISQENAVAVFEAFTS